MIKTFLSAISPVVLLQQLQRFALTQVNDLSVIWLNNDGQQVIGILPKVAFTLRQQAGKISLIRASRHPIAGNINPYDYQVTQLAELTSLQAQLLAYQSNELAKLQRTTDDTGYQNGWMGFISYDWSAACLAKPANLADYLTDEQPLAYFGHYDCYLTYQDNHWQLHANGAEALAWAETLYDWLKPLFVTTHLDIAPKPTPSLVLSPRWTPNDYARAFKKVQAYLKAGDCYQINLTQCWQGSLTNQRLLDYLPQLYQATRAPFAAYLALDGYELLSCSPELFFTFSKNDKGEPTIITKPIKGTRPRGQTLAEDNALKSALAGSEKDRAENVMIVDLLRNDLGKYAKTGSVKVPKLFAIESFSNVHHMVSTITATLKDDGHPLTVLFDSLPAGSITGTPKKRAVEIINELEVKPRGAYCGTMGYLNFDGIGQWNVLIRTLQAQGRDVSLWAGGGVTIASDCEAEYQECFDKVSNLLNHLANP